MHSRPSVLKKLLSPRLLSSTFSSTTQKLAINDDEKRRDERSVNIYQPLIDLQRQRQLVEVSVRANGRSIIYQSMILDIDVFSQTLFLDTLTPINPYAPVKVGDTLLISHHINGEVLSFAGKLKAISSDRHALYAMELPAEIGYISRRFFSRWIPKPQHPIALRLTSPQGIPWSAKVINISAGGARVAIGGNLVGQLSRDAYFAKLSLSIAGGFTVNASAQLKCYKYNRRPYEHTELSIAFRDISFQQRLKLQNYICYQIETEETAYSQKVS